MSAILQKQILEQKFITRWIFNGLLINLRSTKCIWRQKDLHKFKIYNWEFELDEANIESLQLICSAIETYGRIMLGYGDKERVSEESFFNDFQKVVERFIKITINDKKIKKFKIKVGRNQTEKEINISSIKQNSKQSLKDIPED